MSDEGLPLKYRPNTFEKVVGQDVLVRFTSELIRRGQIGKNLMISGGYGSGKTTTARIYGRALNCTTPEASGSPCLQCANCVMLNDNGEGFPDYIEFDGSSQGTKERIANLVELARTKPMYGRKRIVVVDEAQGVSKQGFDSILKLVEEPPPFLVWIFLTTEKNKIRPAIQSRCQDLEVKLLDARTAVRYLKQICELEGFEYEDGALDLIAFTSHGHPRDLLKNLEQVSTLGKVSVDNAKDAFSIGFIQNLVGFSRAVFSENVGASVKALRDWADAPSRKIDTLREFFLYFYYNAVLDLQLGVNPVFDLIPRGDLQEIAGLAKTAAAKGTLTLPEAWPVVNKFWGSVSAQTDAGVELEVLNFYHLINTHRMRIDRVGTALPSDTGPRKEVAKKHTTKGRQFVHTPDQAATQQAAAPVQAAPAPTPAVQVAPGGKVYPHTLLNHGFKPLAKADMRIDDPTGEDTYVAPAVNPLAMLATPAPTPEPVAQPIPVAAAPVVAPTPTPQPAAAPVATNMWGVTPAPLPTTVGAGTKVYATNTSVDEMDMSDL